MRKSNNIRNLSNKTLEKEYDNINSALINEIFDESNINEEEDLNEVIINVHELTKTLDEIFSKRKSLKEYFDSKYYLEKEITKASSFNLMKRKSNINSVNKSNIKNSDNYNIDIKGKRDIKNESENSFIRKDNIDMICSNKRDFRSELLNKYKNNGSFTKSSFLSIFPNNSLADLLYSNNDINNNIYNFNDNNNNRNILSTEHTYLNSTLPINNYFCNNNNNNQVIQIQTTSSKGIRSIIYKIILNYIYPFFTDDLNNLVSKKFNISLKGVFISQLYNKMNNETYNNTTNLNISINSINFSKGETVYLLNQDIYDIRLLRDYILDYIFDKGVFDYINSEIQDSELRRKIINYIVEHLISKIKVIDFNNEFEFLLKFNLLISHIKINSLIIIDMLNIFLPCFSLSGLYKESKYDIQGINKSFSIGNDNKKKRSGLKKWKFDDGNWETDLSVKKVIEYIMLNNTNKEYTINDACRDYLNNRITPQGILQKNNNNQNKDVNNNITNSIIEVLIKCIKEFNVNILNINYDYGMIIENRAINNFNLRNISSNNNRYGNYNKKDANYISMSHIESINNNKTNTINTSSNKEIVFNFNLKQCRLPPNNNRIVFPYYKEIIFIDEKAFIANLLNNNNNKTNTTIKALNSTRNSFITITPVLYRQVNKIIDEEIKNQIIKEINDYENNALLEKKEDDEAEIEEEDNNECEIDKIINNKNNIEDTINDAKSHKDKVYYLVKMFKSDDNNINKSSCKSYSNNNLNIKLIKSALYSDSDFKMKRFAKNKN